MDKIRVDYYKKEIITKKTNRNIVFPWEIQNDINQYWDNLIKEKPWFTRGKVYCAKNIKEEEENCIIELDNSDYAHYLYGYNKNREYICINCFAGVLMETIDGYYVLGEMGGKTEVPNELRFVGSGTIDDIDFDEENITTLNTARRELKEEVGLDLNLFERKPGAYVISEGERKSIGIIYKVYLNMNKEELKRSFDNHLKYLLENKLESEFNNLFFIKKSEDDIGNMLNSNLKLIEYITDVLYKDLNNS